MRCLPPSQAAPWRSRSVARSPRPFRTCGRIWRPSPPRAGVGRGRGQSRGRGGGRHWRGRSPLARELSCGARRRRGGRRRGGDRVRCHRAPARRAVLGAADRDVKRDRARAGPRGERPRLQPRRRGDHRVHAARSSRGGTGTWWCRETAIPRCGTPTADSSTKARRDMRTPSSRRRARSASSCGRTAGESNTAR